MLSSVGHFIMNKCHSSGLTLTEAIVKKSKMRRPCYGVCKLPITLFIPLFSTLFVTFAGHYWHGVNMTFLYFIIIRVPSD